MFGETKEKGVEEIMNTKETQKRLDRIIELLELMSKQPIKNVYKQPLSPSFPYRCEICGVLFTNGHYCSQTSYLPTYTN